ncbi:hypothetical protein CHINAEXTREME_11305 [Halobiforma lacisalsi AJ5]|uniref:Nucleotidyltransferase n=1 Tax=Natronobacterium lacisalsi AJ5 TaxID=358396 RepID=M0L331_NATLA|nr:hypothetical protein [Halobiforma lacisalsi]APW98343.1 hypothetical protein CHINAEXTREME_11305 [Halobiforma lacisalsi AJ5]EMA27946.1 hypothetical protein C445_19877 [Halobiforma lacisalsi AJ5]
MALESRYLAVVRTLTERLPEHLEWALTGSTAFALQGVPVEPNDVDVQTTEDGAYGIADRFPESVVDPVPFEEGDRIRSHFGALERRGVRVEIMGAVQKRDADGTWELPVDVAAHRTFAMADGTRVPVLSLEYEAKAYERLGRSERAKLLCEYAETDSA